MADMTILSVAQDLLGCVCEALGSQDPPWEGDCCIHPGQVSFDQCCETGGQAWVRFVKSYLSTTFPLPDETADPSTCAIASWVYVYEVGSVRCVCFDMCSCEVKTENAQKVYGDAEALLQGMLCCFNNGACAGADYRILGQELIGPEGGCGGSKIMIAVRQAVCCP